MEQVPDNNVVSPAPSRSKNFLVCGIFLLAGLLVGAAFGYRVGQAQCDLVEVVVTATPGSGDQALTGVGTSSAETPAEDNQVALPQSLMDVVLSDTRHF